MPVNAKASGLYTVCTLAKNAAMRNSCQDALMLDWEGNVAEATSANIFFTRDGVLHTPVADRFLNGITRQTIIQLAANRKVRVLERRIQPDELPTFDACFITGTAAEVTIVRQIYDHIYEPNDLVRQLRHDYERLVRGRSTDFSVSK